MKIVLGLIPADSGEIRVNAHPPGSATARAAAAYLPENVAFHPALTGLEQLSLYLRLKGERSSAAIGLLEQVGLAAAARRRIGGYSKGMRQRLGLAQALIGAPRLLVLDEPTSGLDPVSRRDFYALLDRLAAQGAAILLSSHALTEVEARTDRIAILARGRLVADDTLAALRRAAQLPIRFQLATRPETADEVARRLTRRPAQRRHGRYGLTLHNSRLLNVFLGWLSEPAPGVDCGDGIRAEEVSDSGRSRCGTRTGQSSRGTCVWESRV